MSHVCLPGCTRPGRGLPQRANRRKRRGMKELIAQLVAKADLSEAQATQVADVVRGFLSSKLPEMLRGPVDSALTGENVDSAVDQAKGLLGKLF
jgi:hypothetical protein